MTPDLVVAIDCSTTAAKAVVLDHDGRVLAQASHALATSQPRPASHEQDANAWWSATRAALVGAISQVDGARIGAIGLTNQRESFVCLDDDGDPLRPAILWLDGRAQDEISTLGTARVHEVSGKPPDTTPAIYKLAWLARHEPNVLERAARVGDVQAYLSLKMTGRWATSHASADTLGLLDLQRREWSPELVRLAGVRVEQLPALVPAGHSLGLLTARIAADVGLPGPVPLVAGLGDGQSAGLALGADEPGVAYLNLGTSMVLGVRADDYVWDPGFRTLEGMVPGTYTLETVLNAAAYLAGWCRREFGTSDADGAAGAAGADEAAQLAWFEEAASAVPVGCEGLVTLPYWNAAQTPYWDPLARGAVVGWHGRHTRAHLYRSILEGVAFELRLHLGRLEEVTGTRLAVIRAVGGGARSPLWTRIVADVTQRTVQVCSAAEVSAAGAGALAFAHLAGRPGEPTWPTPPGDDALPDASVSATYDRLYAVYHELYPSLREAFAGLARAIPGAGQGEH